MATLIELDGASPTIGADVFLAPDVTLIGDVRIGDRVNIWYGAVLRGDFSYIEIGEGSSIQDNCVVHCAAELPTLIGRDVLVGHGSILEGCSIGDGALIGMGSIVCQEAVIGEGTMLAAGSVVSERTVFEPGVLGAGVPASPKKTLDGAALKWVEQAAPEYQKLRTRYLKTAKEI
jgi:carbonic anhydrase/acetyltransferase-like protein (isoleucine patch superfamily)